MWSHYAGGHSGICIEYEVKESKKMRNTVGLPLVFHDLNNQSIDEYHTDIRKVEYCETLPLVSLFDFLPVLFNEHDIDLENLSKARWHPFADELLKFFLCKLSPWQSEKEWRTVEVNFKPTMPEDRIQKIDDKAIVGIYFGSKSSSQFRQRVMNIYRPRKTPVQFYQCTVDGSRGVQVKPIDDDEE